jgi:hypothetical protein
VLTRRRQNYCRARHPAHDTRQCHGQSDRASIRWRDTLESGEYATIREIAVMEKNNETYVGRVMRLTLLAPDTVEAILNGRQPAELQMDVLMRRFSVE